MGRKLDSGFGKEDNTIKIRAIQRHFHEATVGLIFEPHTHYLSLQRLTNAIYLKEISDGFEERNMRGVLLHGAKIHLFGLVLVGDNQQNAVVG